MQQHELRQPKGATHKRKRVGRGNASGHGTYSTRGMKGQKARSGGGVRPGFEGGQLPLTRRMARKRGFTNAFRIDYEEVNVGKLERFGAGATVTAETLRAARLAQTKRPLKILGFGDLTVALTVEAARFSKGAREKIEAAGGSIRWLDGEPQPKEEKAPKKKRGKKAAAEAKTEATAEAAEPKAKSGAQAEATSEPGTDDAPKAKRGAKAEATSELGTDDAPKTKRGAKSKAAADDGAPATSDTVSSPSDGAAAAEEEEAPDGAGR